MFESFQAQCKEIGTFCYDNFVLILIGLFIFLLFSFLRKKIAAWLSELVHRLLHKWPRVAEDIAESVVKPIQAWLPFFGLYLAFLLIQPGDSFMSFMAKVIRIANIILVTWILMNLTPLLSSLFIKYNEENPNSSTMAIKFMANVLKVIIIFLAVAVTISELGYNVNGIITGLGIGGLTLSLAAQNTASNLFAGMEIVADKPFDVGDYIKCSSAEGFVEDMTMRSTRIRTISDMQVIVPNSQLMNESVTNYSRMGRRYENITLGLTYDTPNEVMKQVIKEIQDMLYVHEEVDNTRIVVCFSGFSDSSLDINIIYFTTTTDQDKFFQVREDVNFQIRSIVEKNGASFAFPSTSVYVETESKGE